MTDEQFEKARRLCDKAGMEPVWFGQGYIEALSVDDRQSSHVYSDPRVYNTLFCRNADFIIQID
jgi:hypothetical protein